MKVIIIDDEPKARRLLRVILEENCPAVSHIEEAADLLAGVERIKAERPALVFLDIRMPEHSGLEIVDFIDREQFDFELIFTTAHHDYALQAFELSAVSYLLKPVRPRQVREAVEKARRIIDKGQIHQKLEQLRQALSATSFGKLALPVAEGIHFVAFGEVILLKANGMYTQVCTRSEEFLISKPLKHFVEILATVPTFYRPHRSYLINLSYIKQYVKKDGGYILMDNGLSVSVAKDKKEEFLSIVQNL